MVRLTGKIISLADYRQKNAEELREDISHFSSIIDSHLFPVQFHWYFDQLKIGYSTDFEPLAQRLKKNPAWGLQLFSVIKEIQKNEKHWIFLNKPHSVSVKRRQMRNDWVVNVTFSTYEKVKYDIYLPEQTLFLPPSRGGISHIYSEEPRGV